MNKLPVCVLEISRHNGCVLLRLESALGSLYSLMLEPCEFETGENLIAAFKENEIVVGTHAPLPSLNTFCAHIEKLKRDGFFTRLHLLSMPISCSKQHSPSPAPLNAKNALSKDHIRPSNAYPVSIYALLPSTLPLELHKDQSYMWHIPCCHIMLEKGL